jgi:hypothetical protein
MRTRLSLFIFSFLILTFFPAISFSSSINLEIIAVTDSKPGEVELTFVSKISNKRSYQITAKPKSGVGLTFSKTYKKRAAGYITHKISPLSSGVDYIFTITATTTKNKLIKSAPYNYLVSSTVPSTPLITKVEATDADEAVVFFTAPKDDGGTPIYYYTVTSNPGAISVIAPIQGSGSVTVTGLTKATTYTFTLTAHNINGSSRAATSPAPITTLAEKIVRTSPTSTSSTTNASTLAAPAFTLSSSSQSVAVGIAITTVTNISTGGVIASYAISPAAPTGLAFSTITGELSGSPTIMASATTYTITATNASGSATQTFAFTVTIGAANKAMITTQPSGAVNAIAFTTQPVIRITDLSENTITTSSSNVVASIASGTGTLTGTTTVAAVNGVATFTNLVITGTAGTFTLTFTPTSLTAATSSSLTLSAGAANRAAITRASVGTSYGVAFTTQPQITIQDASGNTITSSSAAVVTATVSAGGTLVGTATATASSGVATFINLGIKGISGTTYTITYTASGLTSATQSVIPTALTIGAAGQGGGRIFYVAASEAGFSCGPTLSETCYYLEAAPTTGTNNWTDAVYWWSGNNTTLIGVTAQRTAVGTGYANTLAIVTQVDGGNSTEKAGTISRAYGGPNSLTDWYLPSKDELNQMCKWQRGITGTSLTTLTTQCTGGTRNTGSNALGFSDNIYRSSSEFDENFAWYQLFATGGNQGSSFKSAFYRVRPIRAF